MPKISNPKIVVAVLFLMTLGLFCTRALADEVLNFSGTTMGPIEYNIKIVGAAATDVEKVKKDVEAVFETLNRQMSTYIPDSEVSRFNTSDSTDWFAVSLATAKVVERSQDVSRKTGGAFDITVKPVVERWNFGAGKKEFIMPTEAETKSLLARVGYQKLSVRLDPPSLKKAIPELQIDLSAIAKGYAVDLAAEKLAELGFKDHFVEVGGEVRAAGRKPDGARWRVGIEKPVEGIRDVEKIVELENQSMATSGDYRNFVVIDSKRYSHTINPKNARPVENQMASASVIASDCMTADAYATATMVLGPDEMKKIADSEGLKIFTLQRVFDKIAPSTIGAFPFAGNSNPQPPSNAYVFVATFAVFGIAILAMAVGAILSNKALKGSCGGISATISADGSTQCSVCQNPVSDCVEKKPKDA